ncbi:hypothetical protein EK904_004280 [Melospiza melodia maxima]|nr:hypothetical protein EK904_004280 [Melospiza melodia maxima]
MFFEQSLSKLPPKGILVIPMEGGDSFKWKLINFCSYENVQPTYSKDWPQAFTLLNQEGKCCEVNNLWKVSAFTFRSSLVLEENRSLLPHSIYLEGTHSLIKLNILGYGSSTHTDIISASSGCPSELCKGSYLQSTTGSFPEMPWTCLRCQGNADFAGWGEHSLKYIY